jgi:methylenetetrahydrofolate reductase (NADPH)
VERTFVSLSQTYTPGRLAVSFELFPPKTEKGMANLFHNLDELVARNPAYITCTYGAGGSTQAKTLEVLDGVLARYDNIPVASHLTCVGSTVDELRAYIDAARERGIEYIVALRGDPPQGETQFVAPEGGLAFGNELVELISREYPDMGILVGGYPEVHPEATDAQSDLDNLKRKVDAGADVILTQLFYDNDVFYRFRDRCSAAGITIPVVPGVLPVTNLAQVKRITSMCGAALPEKLTRRLEAHGEDDEGQFSVGVYYAGRQVEDLVENGVPGVHFYVLNKSRAAAHICRALVL